MTYDIFISYRRIGGYETAKHLYDLLSRDGYQVSFDIDTLRNGNFDVELLKRIDECTDFIIILNKGVFDRCSDTNKREDWLRNELAHALKQKKNVIPIMLSGFTEFPNNLPDDIIQVSRKNGPKYDQYFFDEFYIRLKKNFLDTPSPIPLNKENIQGQCVLKIHPNHPCAIFVDNEFKTNVKANEITKISFNKGTYYLEFVSEITKIDKYIYTYKTTDENEYLTVDLDSIVKERIETENAEFENRKKEIFASEIENDMIFVERGTFTRLCETKAPILGSKFKEKYHQVTLSSFKIGKFQITQELWQKIMDNNPSYFKGDNLPVEQVSWNDIVGTSGKYVEINGIKYYENGFIYKLNQKTGKQYRLPTEAEWEYAARGGNYCKGYKYSGSNNIDEVGWYDYIMPNNYGKGNSNKRTQPVGTKKPNELGIYDMSGNVEEWCSDYYGHEYNAIPENLKEIFRNDWRIIYNINDNINPQGPKTGTKRVVRGGNYSDSDWSCEITYKNDCFDPNIRNSCIGFRVAHSIE